MLDRTSRRRSAAYLLVLSIGSWIGAAAPTARASAPEPTLRVNEQGYFETRGLNVLVFSNSYDSNFSDSKISGIEIIHHEVRTATNGDVRLSPTPGQWDPIGKLVDRKVDAAKGVIEAHLAYAEYDFTYSIRAEASGTGILLSVILDKPLPAVLAGRAGLNLEFLPAAYFHKSYLIDGTSGVFPVYPSSPMRADGPTSAEPMPIANGKTLVLAPEDPSRRVSVKASDGDIAIYDGRNTAQNGWYVVRSLIPSGRSGKVVEWTVSASTLPNWIRPPVIAHSQVGYAPSQKKVAVLELDRHDSLLPTARVLRIRNDGEPVESFSGEPKSWGTFLRYAYATFDFTSVREPGLYEVEYGGIRTRPFRIAGDVYEHAWEPTLDVYFPVQMDHMFVNEAYRVWHGLPHMDDARQAPVNHDHLDLYAQGPTTDTPFKSGEHIPGLNVGAWFDAGDFDIRTQTQYAVVLSLVESWERFGLKRDETSIDEGKRHVEIHIPDGVPDILQQIEHGTLGLLAQYRAVGHAINGIVEPDVAQYTHLGDASTKTDGLVYRDRLAAGQVDGPFSGTPDDRWAFTSKSSALNYGSIASLAAASRALHGYDDALADECLATAKRVWDEEHTHAPDAFRHGNTTGGRLEDEELKAAVELLIATKDPRYARRVDELWPTIDQAFFFNAPVALRAMPYMDASFAAKLEARTRTYRDQMEKFGSSNPFGVPIAMGGWAGNGGVIQQAITNYELHKAFPEVIDAEAVFRGLNYIYGCHPASDISFVSGVGTVSKEVAYGNNRADFTFIAGGVVPGVLVIKPDFPENKEDWPFLWGENEYVVNEGSAYIYLVNAANELVKEMGRESARR